MLAVTVTVDLTGDRELFDRASKRLRNTIPLMRRVGQYGVGRAVTRLGTVLKQGEGVIRTGRLTKSLTVFEVGHNRVSYGSNVPYAAQVHFGGTIRPKPPHKALAIPLIDKLKRDQVWPSELDPDRTLLQLVPRPGKPPLLVNPEKPLTGRQRKKRGVIEKYRSIGLPPGPLYVLVPSVTQRPRPYLYFDDADCREVGEMAREWIVGSGE